MSSSHSDSYNHRIIQPNWTQIPNVIFDYWMYHLDSSTFKLLLFICRKTLGWHKNKDCLSLKKLEQGTHLSKSTITRCIKELETFGLIKKELHKNRYGDQDPNTYELIINEVVVQNLDHPVQDLDNGGSAEFRQGVVQNLDTQKKDLQKKNTSKEDIAPNATLRSYDIDFSFESASFEGIIEKDLSSWKELYPAVDVGLELKKMAEWCIANPKKAKSKKKWRQFINNWLRENNEKIINKQAYQSSRGGKEPEKIDQVMQNQFTAALKRRTFYSSMYEFNELSKCVELTPRGNGQPICINYSENGFKEQLENAMRKCGFTQKKMKYLPNGTEVWE